MYGIFLDGVAHHVILTIVKNQQYNVEFVNDNATNVAKHLAAGIAVEFGNNDFHKF